MQSKVYFKKLEHKESPESIGQAALALFRAASADDILEKNDFLALKIHFGEKGNKGYIKPATVKILAEFLKGKGTRPFLTDTNTLYRGQRDNSWNHLMVAHEHGFSIENCGIPSIISDGLKGQNQVLVKVPGEMITETHLASDITLCAGIIGLSHLTGHLLTGFGATIKNIGMGCAGRGGKLLQHSDVKPFVKESECVSCGMCAKWCPEDAVTVTEKAVIKGSKCIGCGECFSVCPVGAIKHSWKESSEVLQKKMVEHALAAVGGRESKSSYFNFMTHFTRDCDCMSKDGPCIDDVGVLFSTDPVAVDKAALDILEELHGDSFITDMWPGVDPQVQLNHAEKLGMGSQLYELVSI